MSCEEVWKMMVEGGGTREVSYWFRTGSGSMENISDPDPPHCFAARLYKWLHNAHIIHTSCESWCEERTAGGLYRVINVFYHFLLYCMPREAAEQ